MKFKENLILIGMPAAGKSTVGVLLAKRLGFSFVDTDLLIQKKHGRLLNRLIAELGMEKFLDLESGIISSLSGGKQVIATGGSVVYRPASMAHLATMGLLIFLDVDLANLKQRLTDMDGRGVVRTPGQTMAELFDQRQPLYRHYSQITISTSGLSPGQVTKAIIAKLQKNRP